MSRNIQIVVIGDSREIAINNEIAYELGKYAGQKGWTIITGGKEGVMYSAGKGASEAGGLVVSVLPSTDIDEGHPFAAIKVATGIGWARNSSNVLSGDIIVAVGGGAGTLSEIAYAWTYKKPIVACKWAEGWSAKLAGQQVDSTRDDVIIEAKDMNELKAILDREVAMLKRA